MTDYNTFGHGGTVLPLTASTSNTLLKDADKFLFYALDFFAAQITTYVGTRLLAEVARTPAITEITAAVEYSTPVDPQLYFEEEQFAFPLLAVFRKSATIGQRTVVWRHDDCSVGVMYVLPPLTGAQAERILPVLNAVKQVLDHQCEQGWDPAYTPPGGSLAQNVWTLAGIERIEFKSASYGAMPGANNLWFPTLSMELSVQERVMPVASSFSVFDGVDTQEHVEDIATDTVLQDVVKVASRKDPTVTSLSVTSGPAAGGTSTVITGTGFYPGCVVRFGGDLGTVTTYTSTTSITVATPAHSAAVVDVVVTNLSGQSGTLTDGFTFT